MDEAAGVENAGEGGGGEPDHAGRVDEEVAGELVRVGGLEDLAVDTRDETDALGEVTALPVAAAAADLAEELLDATHDADPGVLPRTCTGGLVGGLSGGEVALEVEEDVHGVAGLVLDDLIEALLRVGVVGEEPTCPGMEGVDMRVKRNSSPCAAACNPCGIMRHKAPFIIKKCEPVGVSENDHR